MSTTTSPEVAPITPPPTPPALPAAIKLTATQFTQLLAAEEARTKIYETAVAVHQQEMIRLARIQQAVMVETHKLIRYQAEHMMTPRAHIVLALLSARMSSFGTTSETVDDITKDIQPVVESIMSELFRQVQPTIPDPVAVAAS